MKAHTFTDTRILNVHRTKSQCECICVHGFWCGFKIFPVTVSVKWCVPNNASLQCFREVTNFGMAQLCSSKVSCDNLSGEEMHRIHWIFPVYIRTSWDMYECARLACYKCFNYSDGFMHILWWISAYFFIGLKVVVYLPSKDIVGNDVTSRIFVCSMIILRHESVCTFRQPLNFIYYAYLSSCF
jgi:hypothetical protein